MDVAEWQSFVTETEIIVVTRFSFLGESGFKSDFSQKAELLFNPDRLALRLTLFETLTLASLAEQTDKNFHLFVLCSKHMPRWALKRLKALCQAGLPEGNFTVAPRDTGPAAAYLRRFLAERLLGKPAFHTVLDDDDGLSSDFIARLRAKMATLPPLGQTVGAPIPEAEIAEPDTQDSLRFISFAQGYALLLRDHADARLKLFKHRYPFINLGLAMVGPPRGRNILSIAHRKVPKQHVHLLLGHGRPMFLRCVHSANDSRVVKGQSWSELPDWRKSTDVRRRFAFLTKL